MKLRPGQAKSRLNDTQTPNQGYSKLTQQWLAEVPYGYGENGNHGIHMVHGTVDYQPTWQHLDCVSSQNCGLPAYVTTPWLYVHGTVDYQSMWLHLDCVHSRNCGLPVYVTTPWPFTERWTTSLWLHLDCVRSRNCGLPVYVTTPWLCTFSELWTTSLCDYTLTVYVRGTVEYQPVTTPWLCTFMELWTTSLWDYTLTVYIHGTVDYQSMWLHLDCVRSRNCGLPAYVTTPWLCTFTELWTTSLCDYTLTMYVHGTVDYQSMWLHLDCVRSRNCGLQVYVTTPWLCTFTEWWITSLCDYTLTVYVHGTVD